MKICAWNCQGIGGTLIVHCLRGIIKSRQPDLIFLMETKNKDEVVQAVARRMKYGNCLIEPAEGKSGGLCIMWSWEGKIDIISQGKYCITLKVEDPNNNSEWFLLFIYGPTDFNTRKILWDELVGIGEIRKESWLCLGDWNDILSNEEKIGGNIKEDWQRWNHLEIWFQEQIFLKLKQWALNLHDQTS